MSYGHAGVASGMGAREDFQDETFRIIANLIADAIQAQREKDPYRLFANIDSLYVAASRRVDKKDKDFERDLMGCMSKLYPVDGSLLASDERTRVFMELRSIWKRMAVVLDDQGLMFRARSSPMDMIRRD